MTSTKQSKVITATAMFYSTSFNGRLSEPEDLIPVRCPKCRGIYSQHSSGKACTRIVYGKRCEGVIDFPAEVN